MARAGASGKTHGEPHARRRPLRWWPTRVRDRAIPSAAQRACRRSAPGSGASASSSSTALAVEARPARGGGRRRQHRAGGRRRRRGGHSAGRGPGGNRERLRPTGSACPTSCRRPAELAVRGTRLRALELGWMQPGPAPFVNVASAGLPAPAARTAGSWKRLLGPLAYAAGALSAGLSAKPLGASWTATEASFWPGMRGRSRWRPRARSAAGAAIEEADPSDGQLEVVAIEAGPRLGLVGLAYRLRTRRGHGPPARLPLELHHRRGARARRARPSTSTASS